MPGIRSIYFSNDAKESFFFATRAFTLGHHVCGDDVIVAFADAGEKPSDPHSVWSNNTGGSCEIDLFAAQNGDVQGKITGTLVSNDAASTMTLETSYIYHQEPRPRNLGGPPPNHPAAHPVPIFQH